MKKLIVLLMSLVMVLTFSFGNLTSAYAGLDGYEITNLPEVMYLTDEPVLISDIEYINPDGEPDYSSIYNEGSYLNTEIKSPSNSDILKIEFVNRNPNTGKAELLFTPVAAGTVRVEFKTVLNYYKTIYIIDPAADPADRDIPQNLKVEKYVPKKLNLSWDPVYGATEYKIYRSKTGEDGTFKRIKNTTGTTYTDIGLTSGKTYYYKIKAVTADGTSKYSEMKKCRVARKLNISVKMRNTSGKKTRFAKVEITNKGKNSFKIMQDVETIAGRTFISYAYYYPYSDASPSDATLIGSKNQPLSTLTFKKNSTGVATFMLDNYRIPQKGAHIIFEAYYDGVYYTISAYSGDVYYSYGYPGCGVKYNDDKVYQL